MTTHNTPDSKQDECEWCDSRTPEDRWHISAEHRFCSVGCQMQWEYSQPQPVQTQEASRLLPCPFCLGPAQLTSTIGGDAGDGYVWQVGCDENNDCPMMPSKYAESEDTARHWWNSRASIAAVEGDAHNRAVQLVDAWAIDRKLAPPQRYPVQQDFRILKEWIARALTDAAVSSSAPAEHDSCSHWHEDDSDNCVWCGDDLGPTTEADVAPLQPTGEQEFKVREVGSAKGGCFDPDDPAVRRAIDGVPFCPVHKSLDERDELVLEISNNCIACSLHERAELLRILAPFANPDGSQDSVTVLRNAITAATPPTTRSDAAMRAAEEIADDGGTRHLAAPFSQLHPYERALTVDWDSHNARRHDLITKKRSAALSDDEANELHELQWLAGVKREILSGSLPAATTSPETPEKCIHCDPSFLPTGPDGYCYCRCHRVPVVATGDETEFDRGAQWGIDHAQSEYFRGASDLHGRIVSALRETKENFIPVNRALEIIDAAALRTQEGEGK